MPLGARSTPRGTTRLALRVAVGIGLLLGTVALVERYVGWAALLRPWRSLSLATVSAAALLVLASYWVRAVRVYDHFRPQTRGRFGACLRLTLLHNLLNNLVPMRLGEASFPALLARYFGVPVVRAVAALVWFRLTDLHVLAGAGGLALLGSRGPVLLVALLAAWLALAWVAFLGRDPLERRLAAGATARWRGWALEALSAMPSDAPTFWRTLAWTVLNWALKLAAFAWLLDAIAGTAFGPSLLGALAGELSSVLPIHGLAGAGTYEAGVVAGLASFGVPATVALAAAVNLHLFLLGLSLAGGAWGLAVGRARGP